jgi:hypothetical protein
MRVGKVCGNGRRYRVFISKKLPHEIDIAL